MTSSDARRFDLGEEAVVFPCAGQRLVGILHHPAAKTAETGVVIVTGGPQYRIGSHRQFLLLARQFAAAGFPTMRFDHRGTGDSEGEFLGFEHIGADIAAAITALMDRSPELRGVSLGGLCDAASAILFYAGGDSRVAGVLLMNPWVREEQTEARAIVKHYYFKRLLEPAFWRKLASGKVAVGSALGGFGSGLLGWFSAAVASRGSPIEDAGGPLPDRMAQGLAAFEGPVGLILSGRDLTAREFQDATASPQWKRLLADPRVFHGALPAADHTFSRRVWRNEVCEWTLAWMRRIGP
jgi:exosortase A-associated hydrolase 1